MVTPSLPYQTVHTVFPYTAFQNLLFTRPAVSTPYSAGLPFAIIPRLCVFPPLWTGLTIIFLLFYCWLVPRN